MKQFTYKLVESDRELKGAFDVRRDVFVKEQGIPESLVFDGCETEAVHVIVKDAKQVIGGARVRFLEAKQAKLERMAVLGNFRHLGVGTRMMTFIIDELKGRGIEKVVLHAQHSVTGFYQACGFVISGLPFCEVGIKHLKMERRI